MLLRVLLLITCAALCSAGTPRVIGKARPCSLEENSYTCIRTNLAANSKCNLRTRPVQRKLRIASHRFETPNFNASYIDTNLVITGLDNCFVSEFFYNVNSDTGVLGINCPWLNFASDRTLLQHRPLEEDSVFHYRINATYPMVILSTPLNAADTFDMCRQITFAFVAQLPFFHIDPRDKPTRSFLSTDLSLLNTFERETFFYRGSLLARHFVNTRLCDFGCD